MDACEKFIYIYIYIYILTSQKQSKETENRDTKKKSACESVIGKRPSAIKTARGASEINWSQKDMRARLASIGNASKQRQETGTRRPAQLAVYPKGFILTFGSPSFSPRTSAKTGGTCFTRSSLLTKALIEKS